MGLKSKAIALEICPKLTKNEPGYFLDGNLEAKKFDDCWPKSKAIALEICPKLTKNEPGYFLVEVLRLKIFDDFLAKK